MMNASELARTPASRQPQFQMKHHVLLAAMFCGACSKGLGPIVPQTQTERKMIGLLEKFDRWDDNGDGQLDEAELEMGLKESEHKATNVIAFYDTNRNGTISLREAQAGYSRADEAEQRIKARRAAERSAR
jgi:hypothetical protein